MLNVFSLLLPLRSHDLLTDNFYFANDVTLREAEVREIIAQPYSSREECTIALTEAINQGMAHYWGDEVDKYYLRIPFYENYLLFGITHLYTGLVNYLPGFQRLVHQFRDSADLLRKYEFSDADKALERGVGYCSQQAIVLAEMLLQKGIKSKILYLQGHVVTMALVDQTHNRWWIADPDFGVVVRHNLAEIERQPELIVPYYQELGYDRQIIQKLTTIYASPGNQVYNNVAAYHGKDRFYKYYIEYLLYGLKWLIPPTLIILSISRRFSWRKKEIKKRCRI